jgi:hypothetical protein
VSFDVDSSVVAVAAAQVPDVHREIIIGRLPRQKGKPLAHSIKGRFLCAIRVQVQAILQASSRALRPPNLRAPYIHVQMPEKGKGRAKKGGSERQHVIDKIQTA